MRSVVACLLLSLGAATWEHSERTRWIGRWTQKKKFAGQPVDAWLYWCAPPHDKEEWVYMPVMESVAEGLRRFDANASVAYADASVSVDIPGAARALRATTVEHSSANLTARIGRLLGDPAALARCRRQTYHVFRHRFDVAAIFRRAQVPDLLRSLGWRLPPRSGEGRAQGRVHK